MMHAVSTSAVEVGGFALVTDCIRAGNRAHVLLLHGLGGNRVTWRSAAARLAEAWQATVWAIDWPGFGESRTRGKRVTLSVLRDVSRAFLRSQAPEAARWTVCGNSLGGLVALQLADCDPHAVQRVVLANAALPLVWGREAPPGRPSVAGPGVSGEGLALRRRLQILAASLGPLLDGRGLDPTDALARFAPLGLPFLGRRLTARYVRERGVPGVVDDPIRMLFGDASRLDPEIREALIEISRGRLKWADEAARALEQTTLSVGYELLATERGARLIARVGVPVVSVYGASDPLYPLSAWHKLEQVRPDWQHLALPGVGHVPQMEVPEDFVRLVLGATLSRPEE